MSRNRTRVAQEGSSTVLLLAVLFLLSAAAIGVMFLIGGSSRLIARREQAETEREKLEMTARSIVTSLGQDSTPDADSPFDAVWETLSSAAGEGTTVALEDISSRLNLNFMRTELFSKTDLGKLLAGGRTADELRQFRADHGLARSLTAYSDFIDPEALARDFTVYGYANVNTTFEDVLQDLFAARSGDVPSATAFHARIRDFLTRQALVKKEELEGLFGIYHPQLYPLLCVEPEINVNFAPPEVVSAILAYPYGEKAIANSKTISNSILADRRTRELTPTYLTDLIHAQGQQALVFQYLGARTWFWKITASNSQGRVELVVARVPGDQKQFVVLEDHFIN